MRRLWIFLLVLLALPAALRAQDVAKDFARLWQDAGNDENKKREALDRLAKEKSAEAARLLVGVTLMPNETGPIVDHAIARLAELEGTAADDWIREELTDAKHWADRVILVRAIARRTSTDAQKLLFKALKDKAWQVQTASVEGLKRHRTRETIETLLQTWEGLDQKKEESARIAGDIRDTVLVITSKDFLTVADAKSWWSANEKSWKPEKKGSDSIESSTSVTEERVPRLFDDIASRRVILVIDTSASMRVATGAAKSAKNPRGLSRFEVMRQEVKRVIEDLPPNTNFTLITFGDKVLPWKPHLVLANETNRRSATKFVDVLKPDGATNSYGALEQAFKCAEADTIYFLSDGYPTVGKTDFNLILADVKKWNAIRNVRIHAIAFLAGEGKPLGIIEGDKSLPKEFMRRLAQENGGRYKLVE